MRKDTTARDRRIAAMVPNPKYTVGEIATKFKLTSARIKQIADKAGVKSPHVREHPSETEIAQILDLYDCGSPIKEIAAITRRDRDTIRRYLAIHRGYVIVSRPSNHRHWAAWEEKLIKTRYNKSWGEAKLLAEELDRTRDSIIGKANRMGLGKMRPAPHHPLMSYRDRERRARGR